MIRMVFLLLQEGREPLLEEAAAAAHDQQKGNLLSHLFLCFTLFSNQRPDGSHNPGNNLHITGLSSKVDQRDLEAAFAKCGRVSIRPLLCYTFPVYNYSYRYKRLLSCMTRIHANPVVSVLSPWNRLKRPMLPSHS